MDLDRAFDLRVVSALWLCKDGITSAAKERTQGSEEEVVEVCLSEQWAHSEDGPKQ